MTASYSPSSRGNRSRRAPIPSRRSLSVYRSLLAWHSIAYYWLIGWSQLRISGHADATPSSPPRGEWSVVCLDVGHPSRRCCKLKSSKPPATYTRVNDFGPHTDSIFRGGGRLIRESNLYASIYGSVLNEDGTIIRICWRWSQKLPVHNLVTTEKLT